MINDNARDHMTYIVKCLKGKGESLSPARFAAEFCYESNNAELCEEALRSALAHVAQAPQAFNKTVAEKAKNRLGRLNLSADPKWILYFEVRNEEQLAHLKKRKAGARLAGQAVSEFSDSAETVAKRRKPAAFTTPSKPPPADPERVNVDTPMNPFLQSSPSTDVFDIPAEFILNPYKEAWTVGNQDVAKLFYSAQKEAVALRHLNLESNTNEILPGQHSAVARKIFGVDLLEALRKEQVQQSWRDCTNDQKHDIRDLYGAMHTILIDFEEEPATEGLLKSVIQRRQLADRVLALDQTIGSLEDAPDPWLKEFRSRFVKVVADWTNSLVASRGAQFSSDRRPDGEGSLICQKKRTAIAQTIEVKAASEAQNIFLLNKDFLRLGMFGKDAIDNLAIKGIKHAHLLVQAVGPNTMFFVMRRNDCGAYAMTELFAFRSPDSIGAVLSAIRPQNLESLFKTFKFTINVIDEYDSGNRTIPRKQMVNIRPSLNTPSLKMILDGTRDRTRDCPYRYEM
ncbi:hypothetical protein HDU86_001304 [Geranomyces michiganensis]|nr:hypothetical protein HDU86_001304 [Geranomyces michiganensis]